MSLTIVATAGAADANSFATEAEVIAYMAARLNATAWTTVTGSTCTENEKAALIEATREVSTLDFLGLRATDTQALSWPRQYAADPDSAYQDYFLTTTVPQRVKDATCELAFQFLKSGTIDLAALDTLSGVTEKTVDVITTRYQPYGRPTGLARYPRVLNYLRPLLASQINTTTLVRG